MSIERELLSRSEEETEAFAAQLAHELPRGTVLALEGTSVPGRRCFHAGSPAVSESPSRFPARPTRSFRSILCPAEGGCIISTSTGLRTPLPALAFGGG
ncbi:MAG: hypothetical protein L6W00_28550 [Lentisphaeria bacterium]|nr:MAG: hypothetical protein L6W00_28550 [Lentisphaeria bacterium]